MICNVTYATPPRVIVFSKIQAVWVPANNIDGWAMLLVCIASLLSHSVEHSLHLYVGALTCGSK